jgi:hypothetical protein
MSGEITRSSNVKEEKLDQQRKENEITIPPCRSLSEQQKELDAWLAENEQCLDSVQGDRYQEGYNDGAVAAAEAIRQGNWTWEEYQEHLRKSRAK